MNIFEPDYSDPPFGCPPDVVLDLPAPPSVNRTRRVDWRGHRKYKAWQDAADQMVIASRIKHRKIAGKYEAIITLSNTVKTDADAGIKALLDYARRIELVTDDSPKYLRRIVVQWGEVPEGCRLMLREVMG